MKIVKDILNNITICDNPLISHNFADIRVRIAPSPTGNLHVGTARTALFNWLFAKKNNGKFVLRIEDTDLERSEEKYTQNIFDSLKAIGLNWDEGPDIGGEYGPYKQSERSEIYNKYSQKLVESGHAYYCWCTVDELNAEKELAEQGEQNFIYSGRCKKLSDEEVEKFKAGGKKPAVRFSIPSPKPDNGYRQKLKFNDMIKGELEFNTGLTDDFVIMKSNGTPAYNFAVVVDDIEMKISHVIRGEDHISNTPKQILLYEALNAEIPQFAHVGMILAPDRAKLSKRHGATAVSEFIEQGYMPEAFINFLTLLGWSSPDGEEIKSLDEIIKLFSMDRVSSTPAIFEFNKLNWLNGVYMRTLPLNEITRRAKKYLEEYDLSVYSQQQLETMTDAVKNNLVKLNEITDSVSYFFGEQVDIGKEIRETILNTNESQKVLTEFMELTEKIDYRNIEKINEKLGEFRNQMKPLKPGQVMGAVRAALTGRVRGADMAVIIFLLGKGRVKLRIKHAVNSKNELIEEIDYELKPKKTITIKTKKLEIKKGELPIPEMELIEIIQNQSFDLQFTELYEHTLYKAIKYITPEIWEKSKSSLEAIGEFEKYLNKLKMAEELKK